MRRPAFLPRLIRVRLTLWYTGLVALVLAAFVWTVFAAFSQYQQSVEDYTGLLTQTFKEQVVQVDLPPYSARGHGVYAPNLGDDYYGLRLKDPDAPTKAGYPMTFYDLTTGRLIGAPPTHAVLTVGAARTARHAVAVAARRGASAAPVVTTTGQWRFITVPLSYAGDQVVGQIAVPTARVDREIAVLKRILVWAAAALLLLAAGGGWMLARRALAPVDALTRRARLLTERDLSQRFNLSQDDEVGRLAAAFDDMIGRLDAAFARQKRFTAPAGPGWAWRSRRRSRRRTGARSPSRAPRTSARPSPSPCRATIVRRGRASGTCVAARVTGPASAKRPRPGAATSWRGAARASHTARAARKGGRIPARRVAAATPGRRRGGRAEGGVRAVARGRCRPSPSVRAADGLRGGHLVLLGRATLLSIMPRRRSRRSQGSVSSATEGAERRSSPCVRLASGLPVMHRSTSRSALCRRGVGSRRRCVTETGERTGEGGALLYWRGEQGTLIAS